MLPEYSRLVALLKGCSNLNWLSSLDVQPYIAATVSSGEV